MTAPSHSADGDIENVVPLQDNSGEASGIDGAADGPERRNITRKAAELRALSPSNYTQTEKVKRPLGWYDVLSLVMNKMIGTGIFTTPGIVLKATRNKRIATTLWACGGLYSFLCVLVYLEFGHVFTYNGAELIYLDRAYDPQPQGSLQPRKHTLLLPFLFSGYIICLGHTAGNSIAFARHVLEAANAYGQDQNPDKRLVTLIAILILSIVCLLHYWSRELGLFLNRVFATYKIALLFAVFVAGVVARTNPDNGVHDWGTQPLAPADKPDNDGMSRSFWRLAAFIYVMYSYTGWENANYVAGEIDLRDRSPRTLRWGAFGAVLTTSVLYVLAVVGYYLAIPYENIILGSNDTAMARSFAQHAFGHTLAFRICICLSAFGNLISVVFTNSKVKQIIAIQNYIPFSHFFARTSPFGTPDGALMLHWACSTIVIIATPDNADGYGFILGLLTYGQLVITLLVVIRLPWLVDYMRENVDYRIYRPIVRNHGVAWTLVLLVAGCNLLLIISAPIPSSPGEIPRKLWAAVVFGIFGGATLYWSAIRKLLEKRVGQKTGVKADLRAATAEEHTETFIWTGVPDGTRWRFDWRLGGLPRKFRNGIVAVNRWMVQNVY